MSETRDGPGWYTGCTSPGMRHGLLRPWGLALALVAALSAACATNPVTGRKQMTMLSEAEEIAISREQDVEIRREMGVYDDPALQRYVGDLGQRLAALSHRPHLPWTFTVLDSPAVNAFALPGGYIYITRGILAYLDDEAELAGVLGHEIAHVTARHAAQAYTRQAQANLGLTVLSIFVPSTQPFTDLGAAGLGVLFLRNSREAELEADGLGAAYAAKGGWDPRGVPRFLKTLSRVAELSERGVPNWLSTHPDPGSRVERVQAAVAAAEAPDATARNHEPYLDRLDGLAFGDSAKDGIVRGHVFLHPLLRLGVEFPDGWDLTNTADAVMAREPGTEHYMVLQGVDQPRGLTMEEVALGEMREAGYRVVESRADRLNGLDAHVGLYRGRASQVGRVLMRAAHVRLARQVYVVAGFAAEPEFPAIDRPVSAAIASFRELSRREADDIRPNKVAFHVVRAGDSWQSIAARQGGGLVTAATLAIMNAREVFEQPQPGDRVKIVVAG